MVLDKDGDIIDPGNTGLSVRQYFAGRALEGIIAALHDGIRPQDISRMAGDCYLLADAMIRAGQQ
jgi:hypothetical protein